MDLREARTATSSARHPWERARCSFITALLSRMAPTGQLLDVGAGDGFIARTLQRAGRDVVAVDTHYSPDDIATLSAAGVHAVTAMPSTRVAAAALLLDVIEHVEDDVALLRGAAAAVIPGGVVVVTVPAWPRLFSAHDRALGHHRRYTPASLDAALHRAGLDVVEGGGLFHGLLVPRAFGVLRERLRSGTDHRRADERAAVAVAGGFKAPAFVGDAVVAVLQAEQRLSRRCARHRRLTQAVPGLSLYAVARVPG